MILWFCVSYNPAQSIKFEHCPSQWCGLFLLHDLKRRFLFHRLRCKPSDLEWKPPFYTYILTISFTLKFYLHLFIINIFCIAWFAFTPILHFSFEKGFCVKPETSAFNKMMGPMAFNNSSSNFNPRPMSFRQHILLIFCSLTNYQPIGHFGSDGSDSWNTQNLYHRSSTRRHFCGA